MSVHAGAAATPVVLVRKDPMGDIVARVPSWNDALLRLSLDPAQGGVTASVFISLYGDDSAFAAAPTQAALVEVVRRAFPEQSSELVVLES